MSNFLFQNKLKSGIKNGNRVTLYFWSNVTDDSNDETNFPHKLFLTDTQFSRLWKVSANDSSANITSAICKSKSINVLVNAQLNTFQRKHFRFNERDKRHHENI